MYIPNKLFVPENATATVNNISAHELLFRLGIVSDLTCAVVLILLVLALYRLFKRVDQNLRARGNPRRGDAVAALFRQCDKRRQRTDGCARPAGRTTIRERLTPRLELCKKPSTGTPRILRSTTTSRHGVPKNG